MENNIKESPELTRLEQIDVELRELKEKQAKLKAKWNIEKSKIAKIHSLKADIEKVKQEAEKFERDGNLEKAAEFRYGRLHSLESQLANANIDLEVLQKDGKLLNEEVGADEIADIVAKWTGIPVRRLLESERSKLLKIEERIHSRLVGQEDAVFAVANAIRRSRAGLQDEKKPIGSFIFLGPTGVGKTELAKALAEFLFDDDNAMVRIDMSEYMDKFAITRLIGAPPGYVGYDEGGQLTEAIRQRPYAVILLDEIEKAHPDVFNLLLQVLDDGRLTDSKGRTVNFNNTIIVMTSNLGSELIQEKMKEIDEINREEILSSVKIKIAELLKKSMRPEFLNRIDEIVLFKPLIRKEISKIAEIQLQSLKKRLENSKISIDFDENAVEWLANLGFDPQFGARPLKRALQKNIIDQLAVKILEGTFSSGDSILVTAGDTGGFQFIKK